jgi:lysophospholipase L1-like esterase
MKKISPVYIVLAALFSVMAFKMPSDEQVTIYLVGDSTMADKAVRTYPEAGWGMPFAHFFDSSVRVDNRAKNGRSTRSFREEKIWQPIFEKLREGDYVFIQFGHNDEVPTKKTYTTPDEFSNNLALYVSETRSRKAVPVLITPVARRRFDSTGQLTDTHQQYSELVRAVAQKHNVAMIDLDLKSRELLKSLGPEKSKYLYNWLKPGEHPNYPKGVMDDTHFNELGARKMAQLVLASIRESDLPIKEKIVRPIKK